MSLEETGFLGGFWCDDDREFLFLWTHLGSSWEAGSAWLAASGRELLWPPFIRNGSSKPSEARRVSWSMPKLISKVLLVSGLDSAIFFQTFSQVRQEKIRQDRKRRKTIQEICKEKKSDVYGSHNNYFSPKGLRGTRGS